MYALSMHTKYKKMHSDINTFTQQQAAKILNLVWPTKVTYKMNKKSMHYQCIQNTKNAYIVLQTK